MSYIGTDAHKKQRQYYFEEGLKDKGEWFGPIDETERKKLIQSWYDPENKGADFMGSGEAPNIILTWAQDKDFISRYYKHFIRNYGEENENSNLFKQLLSGKFGYNPSTKTIYRLDKMGDAGKSRVMDTSQDSAVQDYLGYLKDDKYFEKQSIEKNKPLTDYIKDRHLVHIDETEEWRGHMGAYPIFAEDVYQDNYGSWRFRDQEGMETRLTGDPVDLYNYGGRDVYMTDAEEKAYKEAMLQNNSKAMWDSPIMDLPGLVFTLGSGSLIRQGDRDWETSLPP